MNGVLLGEVLLFGGPFAIAGILFYLLGRYKSGLLLVGLLVIFPFAVFFTLVNILPMNDSPDVVIPVLVVIIGSIGAVTGAVIGFAVRKHKATKRQEI